MAGNDLDIAELDEVIQTLSSDDNFAWTSVIPTGTLVGVQLKTIVTAPFTPPEDLINIAKVILGYIKDAQGHNKENGDGDGEDFAEISNMFETFDMCFNRILLTEMEQEGEEAREDLFEEMWALHMKKQIDFSETDLINTLLRERPNLLEPLFLKSLQKWKAGLLAPLCSQHGFTFQIILDFLRQAHDRSPTSNGRVLEFTKSFLECTNRILECPSGADPNLEDGAYPKLVPLYPDLFQPILNLIVQLKLKTVQNSQETTSQLTDQLMGLMNEVYKAHPDETSTFTFVFSLYEPTRKILHPESNGPRVVKFIKYRVLWQVIIDLN